MSKKILLPLAATLLIGACASSTAPMSVAGAAVSTVDNDLHVERVVMLMRHGVRPPTKARIGPDGVADQPWPVWSVDFGELTHHGYAAVRLLGQWDRQWLAANDLLPAEGCPAAGDVVVAASAKSRTQDTARALIEGLAPGCGLAPSFPASAEEDVEFHPIDVGATTLDPDLAYAAVQALAPQGGMEALKAANAERFALLDRALGCCSATFCAEIGASSSCSLSDMPAGVVRNEDDRPDVGDPFGLASTIAQTFLLEYLEGMPMEDVAWGRLTRDDIETLLEFHSIKFYFEGRAPYVAAHAASPLARHMLTALETGPKLTVLVGHDTNIADLGGLLDLHWTVPGYAKDDPPPAGGVGFELLADAQGRQFVRAFYRSQTMDQVRYLQPLTADNPASIEYLAIPGCADLCPMTDFARIVRAKLVDPRAR